MYFSTAFVSGLKFSFDSFVVKKRHIDDKGISKYANRKIKGKGENLLLESPMYLIAGIRNG